MSRIHDDPPLRNDLRRKLATIFRAGISNRIRESQAMVNPSMPMPSFVNFPSLSICETYPRMFSAGMISSTHSSPLSPFMKINFPFLETTLWITNMSESSRAKATIDPVAGAFPFSRSIVMISPSRMKGVMLNPRAQKRNGFPFTSTAFASSSSAFAESRRSVKVSSDKTEELYRKNLD